MTEKPHDLFLKQYGDKVLEVGIKELLEAFHYFSEAHVDGYIEKCDDIMNSHRRKKSKKK
jgi:hypothetical protein